MRLVFITDNGFYESGGEYFYSAPNYTHVGHLKKYFDEFVFVARKDKYDKASFLIEVNNSVHLFKKFEFYKMKKRLKEVIKNADAVICYGINGYFGYRVAKSLGKPVIAYNGGDMYEFLMSRRNLVGAILAPIARYMEREKFLGADFAHYCDDFLLKKYPTSGKVLIASGVSIEIEKQNLLKRISKIENKAEKKFAIGLIGHTRNNLKGIGDAIKAIGLLGDNYELQIVGRGDHQEFDNLALELGISGQIKFLGTMKAGEQIFKWLDSIDLYIQPSKVEGLPRATIEAMSRACPIVSSNAGGLKRLIDDNYRVDYADFQSLANKIRELSKNILLMKEQAEKNFEKSKEFSTENREAKYQQFYGEVIKSINSNL